MKNTLKKWLSITAGAACLALTPVALNLGAADVGLTEAQCGDCCPQDGAVCMHGSQTHIDKYDPGTEPCSGGGGPHIEYRY